MFNRWGPIKLFTFNDGSFRELTRTFHALVCLCDSNKGNGWDEFGNRQQRIYEVASWVAQSADAIACIFPKNRQRQLSSNSNLVVMQYADGIWPLNLDAESKHRGSNFRIVVNADSDNHLECRIGEFPNYSGKILHYRDNYPFSQQCEICRDQLPTGVRIICGRCYCQTCSTKCAKCGHTICSRCDMQMHPFPSLHDWHFHRE